jgi:hypothetical protein
MLTALALALALQQSVVWETPAPIIEEAPPEVAAPVTTLPDWAVADPFGWERSQCNPMIACRPG